MLWLLKFWHCAILQMVKGTKNSILWETICNNGGLLWSNIKHSVIIFSMKVHNCITWLQMILRNIFPIAVKEIPLAKSDITYNQSNAFSSYYYSMENNVFCFFRNVRREIYLGIGSLSRSHVLVNTPLTTTSSIVLWLQLQKEITSPLCQCCQLWTQCFIIKQNVSW